MKCNKGPWKWSDFLAWHKQQDDGENYIMRIFIICTVHPVLLKVIKSGRMMWKWHIACLGNMRNAYRILFREPEK
jgi:hypothetical protein